LKGRISLLMATFAALSGATAVSAQTKGAPAPAQAGASKASRIHFTVAPSGNEARYRVREQLAGFDLPNDAIGATKDITGRIVIDPSGKVLRDSSKIVVHLTELKSDKTRRDNFLKTRTLETTKFPSVELVPVTFDGLAEPIPAGQSKTFSLVGDLTVRGVTRPTTWHVTARADGKDIVGTASTAFTFKDFNLDQPRVPVVLSVGDTIKLEYDFHFAPVTP
jgi:polyisoprenoid-binding protein YceI